MTEKKGRYNCKTVGFCALEFLYLFYYAYRYVFKYNSTTTSVTYRNTPAYIQILKYILMSAVIFYIAFNRKFTLIIARKNQLLFVGILLLISSEIFMIIGYHNSAAFKFGFVLFPVLLFLDDEDTIDIDPVEKIFDSFFAFTTVYECIQIILYLTKGRLPALAYATGKITDVRFGGAWDDPNGYAVLLSFYIPYFFSKYKGGKRIFLELVILIMEVLCWSGTGLICTSISCFIVFSLKNHNDENRMKFWLFTFILIINACGIYFLKASYFDEIISYFLKAKQGSINGHMSGWNLKGMSIYNFLGLTVWKHGTEVGYLVLLFSGGIFNLIVFILIMIETVHRLATQMKMLPYTFDALISGCLGYTIAVILGSLNLPLFYSFSNMGLLSLMICLSSNTLEKSESESQIISKGMSQI